MTVFKGVHCEASMKVTAGRKGGTGQVHTHDLRREGRCRLPIKRSARKYHEKKKKERRTAAKSGDPSNFRSFTKGEPGQTSGEASPRFESGKMKKIARIT